jgi:hypothetical protein
MDSTGVVDCDDRLLKHGYEHPGSRNVNNFLSILVTINCNRAHCTSFNFQDSK